MEILSTPLPDLYVVNTAYHNESRGGFARLFCDKELSVLLGERKIVQINHSVSKLKGSIRGLHFQHPPAAEMKIVRCLKGRVFDVAIDLRKNSSTFLKWHAEILSAENAKAFVIPEGFAHGFQVLDSNSELLYLHTAHYQPQYEDGLGFDDPFIGIRWALPVTEVSDKDRCYSFLNESFIGIPL
jgi:dTDP-4-dehydrorhamnose 3,5-epimerase